MKKLCMILVSLFFISCVGFTPYQPKFTYMMQGQVAVELYKDDFFFNLDKYFPKVDPWGIPDTTLDWNMVYAWPTSVVHTPKTEKIDHYRLIYSAIVYARAKWPVEHPPLLMGMLFPKKEYPQKVMLAIRYKDPDTIRMPIDKWLFYEYRQSDITKTTVDLDLNYQFELFQVPKPEIKYFRYIDFRMGLD